MIPQVCRVSTRPSVRASLSLVAFLILTALVHAGHGASAWAEEDTIESFESLYEDSAEQGAGPSETIIADPEVDSEAWETVLENRKRNLPLLSNRTHHPDRYADLSKREGNWELAPVVVGRRQDGSADPSEVMAPLGLELNRDF